MYFVTMCCEKRIHRFGEIVDKKMVLNEYGQIVQNEWDELPKRFPHAGFDMFQIMPDHIHAIIALDGIPMHHRGYHVSERAYRVSERAGASPAPTRPTEPVGATLAVARYPVMVARYPAVTNAINAQYNPINDKPIVTIGNIVGTFKSRVANQCLEIFKSKNEMMGKLWQRNYYESVIRGEAAYLQICDYIEKNPARWR
jgi:REP element-mobilizing transposase RayT